MFCQWFHVDFGANVRDLVSTVRARVDLVK